MRIKSKKSKKKNEASLVRVAFIRLKHVICMGRAKVHAGY